MRRLLLAAICGLLLSASATSASAGWGHGWHHGWHRRGYASYAYRPYRHHYHGHHYRSYVSRNYVSRHYVARHYAPRYYAYPSFSFSYGYATPYYYSSRYYAPAYYNYTPAYTAPYCASTVPTYSSPSYSSYSLPLRGGTTSASPATLATRTASETSPLMTVASRLISEVAARRGTSSEPVVTTGTLGIAPTTTARARATSLVESGDQHFRDEQYQYALAFYEAAAKVDVDSGEAAFRQGLCGIATGRYDDAVKAFKRGLAVDPSTLGSTFRLKKIYKDDATRTRHVEALAGAALENSNDPDTYFLIGAFLHFEGTPARAEKFLRRASDLSGHSSHVSEFLAASRRAQPLIVTSAVSARR